jgi:hypothetical protein
MSFVFVAGTTVSREAMAVERGSLAALGPG